MAVTWIRDELPKRLLRPARAGAASSARRGDGVSSESAPGLSARGRRIAEVRRDAALPPGSTFAPCVPVAYLVLPEELVAWFSTAREITDGFTSPLLQGVLAEFIDEGRFAAHLRRVRDLYRDRRDRFVSLARDRLPGEARLGPANAGIHLALHLPAHVDDRDIAGRARARGIAVPALSAHSVERPACGLVVHYGNAPIDEMERGVHEIAGILAGTV